MGTSGSVPDACVIGAGLAGALVAYELARRGVTVVVLEAGPRYDPNDRLAYMERRLRDGIVPWRRAPERDVYTNAGSYAYPLNETRVKGVGGTTLHWGAASLRLHETDFRMRTLYGVADDWPLTYDELEPYYGKAEAALGVAGVADNPFASPRGGAYPLPEFPYSYGDELFRKACEKLDIAVHHAAHARNSVPFQGRPVCQAFATCVSQQICPISAQYTAEVHLGLAERTGYATIVPNASVLRINVDNARRIQSVTYAGIGQPEREQRARAFILAAHAVESARLLLLSESNQFPHGLANSSGTVGKRFMEHPVLYARGTMKEQVFPYRIGFHTAETHQFCLPDKRDQAAAFKLEFANAAGPTPTEIAATSGNWGTALADEVRDAFGHYVAIKVILEQLPDPANSITLDPVVRDCFGNPAPRITFSIGAYERAARERAIATAVRILDALGATHIIASFEGEFGMCSHHMGTCRMGDDPGSSVVDRNLKAHDVENLFVAGSSAFVTGGALNPSLTIAALAIRLGEFLVTDYT